MANITNYAVAAFWLSQEASRLVYIARHKGHSTCGHGHAYWGGTDLLCQSEKRVFLSAEPPLSCGIENGILRR